MLTPLTDKARFNRAAKNMSCQSTLSSPHNRRHYTSVEHVFLRSFLEQLILQTPPPNYSTIQAISSFLGTPSKDINPIIMFLIRIRRVQSITIRVKGRLGTNKSQHKLPAAKRNTCLSAHRDTPCKICDHIVLELGRSGVICRFHISNRLPLS